MKGGKKRREGVKKGKVIVEIKEVEKGTEKRRKERSKRGMGVKKIRRKREGEEEREKEEVGRSERREGNRGKVEKRNE